MKRLILTQQQLADAYAVPVKSSIYQYFLGLSDRKEKMIGLIIGEYEFFDDGDIEYKEHDFKEIIVSEETMKAWKLSRKASGQTPLMFTDCYFSLVSLRTLEDLAVGNLAEAAAELVKNHEKQLGLKITRADYFEDGVCFRDSFILKEGSLYEPLSLKNLGEDSPYVCGPAALSWIDERISEGCERFILDADKGELAVPDENTSFLPLRTFAVWGVSI